VNVKVVCYQVRKTVVIKNQFICYVVGHNFVFIVLNILLKDIVLPRLNFFVSDLTSQCSKISDLYEA
jgi:hypothetical protein